MKKIIASLTASAVVFSLSSQYALSAGNTYDYNSDGVTDCLDLVALRQSVKSDASSAEELGTLRDFLLGLEISTGGSYDSDYTIDESYILEPKGTVHTGDGTYYGGGYEGGCAMLDPISKEDYWIVAMNLED
ncbi:MAG: hypothetical protein IJO99_00420, partial [Ruminococcus sp.]|nr:hypothetical protein [Ruminococcus sp.]